MTDARTSLYFQGFPGIVYITGGAILFAAPVVNDAPLKNGFKAVGFRLPEAEFDIDLLILR